MCSIAASRGLKVAALVLVSYPLHPPGRPGQLRTSHFPNLHFPCLFVSGRGDAYGSSEEFDQETATIPGPVTLAFVKGGHSLRSRDSEVAGIVAGWLGGLVGSER
jgi:uncharacterized protein